MGLVASTAEEVVMVEVGDRVRVESEKVGVVTRRGVVTEVDGRLITVHWDSGSSSTFVPSAGCLQVTGHEPQAETVNGS
jgi:acyl dehydratase